MNTGKSSNNIQIIWKPKSVTPHEQLLQIKKDQNITGKSCYAGRLDPMARGWMIYLLNEETKNMEKFMGLSKTYEFYIVLGISTDSMDCMGIIENKDFLYGEKEVNDIITQIKKGSFTEYKQLMPKFSAYKAKHKITGVKKPLWEWARLNELDNINIPIKDIKLELFEYIKTEKIPLHEYINIIKEDISKVNNFDKKSIEKIMKQWDSYLYKENPTLHLIKCRAHVQSGTYIRFLTTIISNYSKIPCHMYDICRTGINLNNKKKPNNKKINKIFIFFYIILILYILYIFVPINKIMN